MALVIHTTGSLNNLTFNLRAHQKFCQQNEDPGPPSIDEPMDTTRPVSLMSNCQTRTEIDLLAGPCLPKQERFNSRHRVKLVRFCPKGEQVCQDTCQRQDACSGITGNDVTSPDFRHRRDSRSQLKMTEAGWMSLKRWSRGTAWLEKVEPYTSGGMDDYQT